MFALKSQRVWLPEGEKPACVLIDDQYIGGVLDEVPDGFMGEVIDLGNLILSPGLIDTHVHINEPGRTNWEGFETATRAAAAGGVTTLVDMPLNCLPVTTSKESLITKLEALKGKLHVDCGFWGGVTPNSLADLEDLLSTGVMGVKSFLIDSGIEEFPPMSAEHLDVAIPKIAQSQLPYLIHAELELPEGSDVEVGSDYSSFLNSRPSSWEVEAIKQMITYSENSGCHVHIVHLSASEALPMIKEAKARGVKITVETCPHYLCLESESVESGQTLFKCCPPIREKSNQESLWQGLEDGTIDFICSDHSPCTANLKKQELGDFGEAWGGISSLQFTLPLIWTELQKRSWQAKDMLRMLCERPAEFLGQNKLKGKIAHNYLADLVVWDPDHEFEINSDVIEYKNKFTPYAGKKVRGQVVTTYLRGERIFDKGRVIGAATGNILLREPV